METGESGRGDDVVRRIRVIIEFDVPDVADPDQLVRLCGHAAGLVNLPYEALGGAEPPSVVVELRDDPSEDRDASPSP